VAGRDPRDERKQDSEDQEYKQGAKNLETLVAQKDGESAAIKKQTGC
jgi:hypothetical protein